MPPSEAQLIQRLSTLRRVSIEEMDVEHLECPICRNDYSFNPGNIEHAVRVQPRAPYTGCHHMFCRRCIEELFRSGHVWGTRCSECRQQWFDPNPEEVEAVQWEDLRLFLELFGAGLHRDVWREAPQLPLTNGHDAPEPVPVVELLGIVQEPGRPPSEAVIEEAENHVRGFSDRGRLERSIAFLQHILAAYDINAVGDGRSRFEVQRVERAIERLYEGLEISRVRGTPRQGR
jgi:hypothetical protein